MKENWKSLIGKRILLKRKYLSQTSIEEATVLNVSGKYVKFKWETGAHSWEIPEDEPSFGYTEILEILDNETPRKIILGLAVIENGDINNMPACCIEIECWDDVPLKEIVACCERKIKQIEVW